MPICQKHPGPARSKLPSAQARRVPDPDDRRRRRTAWVRDHARHCRTHGWLRAARGRRAYRSIRRLLADKLLTESARRPAADLDDERRRYYALSPLGKRVVAAEALRLRALVRAAEASRIIDPEPAR